jgi:cyclohexadieny/prephenate dehydrogenase
VSGVRDLGFCDDVADTPGTAVIDADLVMLCVPVGAMGSVGEAIADDLPADAIVSDVGMQAERCRGIGRSSSAATIIPAHPVAGTEKAAPTRALRRCSKAVGAS